MMQAWGLGSNFIDRNTKQANEMIRALDGLIQLHIEISQTYAADKIFPHCEVLHGLSAAVRSSEEVDVNQRLFDVLGRLSVCGLWVLHIDRIRQLQGGDSQSPMTELFRSFSDAITGLINNNPMLTTPFQDQQAIDINLACLYLSSQQHYAFIRTWIGEIIGAADYSTSMNAKYPCCFNDYEDLLDHPRSAEPEYKQEATAGSVLYPTLAFWALLTGNKSALSTLSEFIERELKHCTLQLWFPADDSETHLYTNSGVHGLALTDFEIDQDGKNLLNSIKLEVEGNKNFDQLSASRLQQWPIILTACRHYRIPVPPNFWGPIPDLGTDGEILEES